MTVDEALSQLANSEHGDPWVADDFDAVATLLRYVKRVREVESFASIDQIPAVIRCGEKLAAAREGRDDK